MAKTNYLAADGYIDVKAIADLSKEITKFATKEGMKPAGFHYASKLIPKFDKAKTKGEKAGLYERKRAQPIKEKKSMPKEGARLKMQVLLRNYKGLEETDFWGDYKSAVKALEQHSKTAEKFVERYKAAARKNNEKAAAVFDKAVDKLMNLLIEAGLSEDDIAIGKSTMGKTMCIDLGKGLFVSIGKADEEKFEKTLASNEEDDDEPKKSKKVGVKAKKAKKSKDDEEDDEDDEPKVKKVKKAVKKVAKVVDKKKKRR